MVHRGDENTGMFSISTTKYFKSCQTFQWGLFHVILVFFLMQHHVSFAIGGHYNAAFWIVQFYGIVATAYVETVELEPGGFRL